jgi:predicted aminopeptidase
MQRTILYKSLRNAVLLLIAILALEGCYYAQAVRGQAEILHKRRPIEEVVADVSTDDMLRQRLQLVQQAREFAADTLLLPDNGSYRTYADLGRDYVVWSVVAAPEFSLEPRRWCYPFAGCVAYRGYFDDRKARQYAERLAASGYDVIVGGVPAYSTLGRFDDPVLNTMLHWSDVYLVRTLYHELAHQLLYVKGDTAFNESFASVVGDVGVRSWLRSRGEEQRLAGLERVRAGQDRVRARVAQTVADLQRLYASGQDESAMREQKSEAFARLAADLERLAADTGLGAAARLPEPLNNARLVAYGSYELSQDSFRAVLANCGGDLACFYRRAGELAELDGAARTAALQRLAAGFSSPQPPAESPPAL